MAMILRIGGRQNGKTEVIEQEITNEVIKQLEAENEKLKEGIEKVKAEIEEYQYENKYAEAVKDDMEGWICASDALRIFNKYLVEVGDKENG